MGNLLAQKDPDAKKILDQVSEKYKSMKGMHAIFEYYYYNEIDGASQTNKGEVTVKDNQYKLVLEDQEIYSNGQTVWTYIKSNGFEEVTINAANPEQDELTPTSIYTIYKNGYDYELLGESRKNGKVVQEVLLTAEDSNAQFQKIKLTIDKENKTLLGWEVSDTDGGTFRYSFKEVNANLNLNDSHFTFDPKKHPQVEVIDLR